MSFLELIDLASERLGGAVLAANDDFFAAKENLLRPKPAIFLPDEYTDRGKWMDGWESRRRRTPGHDWALVRLGLPGVVRGVVVDTAFFRGNFPESCSIEACTARLDADVETLLGPTTRWVELLPRAVLQGDSKNEFAIDAPHRVTHLRLNIFPDGGVARLRVHGDPEPDWRELARPGAEFDLAAIEQGGFALRCSDMFFGERNNMLMPGRGANMGDGWETRRRRGPGHDWSIVRLAGEATLRRLEIDTNHFKGNYPDTCQVEGLVAPADADGEELAARTDWRPVLARHKLQAHTRHFIETEQLLDRGPFTHLRLSIYPDGGVSRFRVQGSLTADGARRSLLRRLDTLSPEECTSELLACCHSRRWARALADRRPFRSAEALIEAAEDLWKNHTDADLDEAFAGHPRIGDRSSGTTSAAAPRGSAISGATANWAAREQAGMDSASIELRDRMTRGNEAYEAKFGHIYLVCATGKTADELLALLEQRLQNDPATERKIAAAEQARITRLRLEKLLTP
ncbi:MAG: allantoicase [Myxococcales bacterium]|nr:MAG: allantoicase [Myxococcales bacterium]